MEANYVGRFARSIESGWLGKVMAVEEREGMTLLRMSGVNELNRMIVGGDIETQIDLDDTQWFVPEDVRFVKLV